MLVLPLALILLYLFYRWATNNDNKWDGTGVKVLKPVVPLLGSNPIWLIKRPSIHETFKSRYDKMKEFPYYVSYFFKEDIVQIQDPEVIKDICIRNFDHFTDRVVFDAVMKTHPEQRRFLTNLKGEEWKILRHGLSPAFTAGKLRSIVSTINNCGSTFADHIKEQMEKNNGKPLQMLTTFKRYTMSVIASGVFGVDAKAYEMEEESDFVKAAKGVQIKFDLKLIFGVIFVIYFPRFCQMIGFRLVKSNPYFRNLTTAAMKHRREHDTQQNDMLKLLADLQNRAKEAKEETNNNEEDSQFESDAKLSGVTKATVIDEDTVTQSAVLFLIAGIDTTSHTLSIVAYHLAMNQDVQEIARREADDIAAMLEEDNFTYDDVKKMVYIEMVVNESLRITPILSALERVCTQDYKLPCGAVIPKDTRINIPIVGIHNDDRYWEDPHKFCPERFSKENKHKIRHGTYLPFGLGPRNCIGMRFALLEVKIALYSLLRNFIIKPSEKTPDPIGFTRGTIFTDVEGSNWLHLVPRKEIH